MSAPAPRLLIVDDNPAIHADFRKILCPPDASVGHALASLEAELFSIDPVLPVLPPFSVDSARQGAEALKLVEMALRDDAPYSMAFVDMRMPPGWDGVETIERLWQVQPELEVVICSAYSDYSWQEIVTRLGINDRLLILKKPFEAVEVRQMTVCLTTKVALRRKAEERLAQREKLTEFRSRFVAMVSHEFRTPLTVVMAASERLKRYAARMTPEQIEERLDKIQSSVAGMTELLDDVLTLSKAEAGRLEAEPTSLDVEAFCRELLAEVGTTTTDRHQLVFEGCGQRTDALLDAKLLRQILSNLLSNAIKYSPDGGCVALNLSVSDDGLTLKVKDQGIGIPIEEQALVFDAFHRSANGAGIQGTGLGLAVTSRAVELLGGQINLTSEVGSGTTVVVTLPRRTCRPSDPQRERAAP
jgi:signal transduction histidine kinase